MSVQVKKRIESLRTYLGRDTKGLELLDLLKDEVTVLRKKLAASEAKAEQEATIKLQARERADATEVALAESAAEMQRLRQQVANLMCDMSVATKPDEPEIVHCKPSTESELTAVVRALLKNREFCPVLSGYNDDDDPLLVVARCSIAIGWSHKALWTLGATVALLTDYNYEIVVTSHDNLLDVVSKDRDTTFNRNFSRWFRANQDLQLPSEEACKAYMKARKLRALRIHNVAIVDEGKDELRAGDSERPV
jgi:hypothetical protein